MGIFLEAILQKRFLRILHKLPWDASVSKLFIENEMLTVNKIYQYKLGTLIFKIRNNLTDKLNEKFLSFNEIHDYNTRQTEEYVLPKIHKERTKAMVSFSAALFWNKLPLEIKKEQDFKKYKKQLKTYLMDMD